MTTTATIEKPVDATPAKTEAQAKTRKVEDLTGVIAIIFSPDRDRSVPSHVGGVPSIRQEAFLYNMEEIPQHADLINNKRTMPVCDIMSLRVGTNWVEREVWSQVKKGPNGDAVSKKLGALIIVEMQPTGPAIKSLTSYGEEDAIVICEATWSEGDVLSFKVDEKRPAVLMACESQLKLIASQYKSK